MNYEEAWKELRERLIKADLEVVKLLNPLSDIKETARLTGKHEGIKIALSYMDEGERGEKR